MERLIYPSSFLQCATKIIDLYQGQNYRHGDFADGNSVTYDAPLAFWHQAVIAQNEIIIRRCLLNCLKLGNFKKERK